MNVEGASIQLPVAAVAGAQSLEVQAPVRRRAIVEPGLRTLTAEEVLKLGGGEPEPPKRVRVRFAPSPTGFLHIGGARTALVNYLFAKSRGGDFLVRIEDTDPMRSKPEYTEAIFDGLKWLELGSDEEVIYQSQRTEIYQRKVEELIAKGKARRDPESQAVYFIMPREGKLVVQDRLKGRIEFDPEPDFVIQRSDGSPMFLLANVVDDGEQKITHILRGHEHLVNAAKQIELFRALDYPVPEFYHMPLILGDPVPDPEDATRVKHRGKLSKRHGATNVIDYQEQGFSPKVLINHLARLGMSFDSRETMSLEELAQHFDPTRMSKKETVLGLTECVKRGAKYEVRPGPLLQRMFAEISRMPSEELAVEIRRLLSDRERVEQYLDEPATETRPSFFDRTGVTPEEARVALDGLSDEQLFALADGGKMRFATYLDAVDFAAIARAPLRFDEKQLAKHTGKKMKADAKKLLARLEGAAPQEWTVRGLDAELEKFNAATGLRYTDYGKSLRWMLTGNVEGFPLHHTMVLLGREETLARLRQFL
jgi:glutamyl-tRNA synthetase